MGLVVRNVKPICCGGASGLTEVTIGDDGVLTDSPLQSFDSLDADGLYLSPGWADLHVHIWFGGSDIAVRPERAGLQSGVTALADAGSAGEATLHGLVEHVIARRPETIRAFVNISSIGLVACNRIPELSDPRLIDVDRTLSAIEANRDVVCGIKVRASGRVVGDQGIVPVQIAKRVANMAGQPLMVHIGEPPPRLEEIFQLLTPGDIVTHCFNGKKGGSIVEGTSVFDSARQLADAGILMDVGHGAASYDFDVAATAISRGLIPHSISTDLHVRNVNGPVHDIATTASKLLAAGLDLDDCIIAISVNPRAFLGLEGSDCLTPGRHADFTLFDVVDCELDAVDGAGKQLTLQRMIKPRYTILGAHCRTVSDTLDRITPS